MLTTKVPNQISAYIFDYFITLSIIYQSYPPLFHSNTYFTMTINCIYKFTRALPLSLTATIKMAVNVVMAEMQLVRFIFRIDVILTTSSLYKNYRDLVEVFKMPGMSHQHKIELYYQSIPLLFLQALYLLYVALSINLFPYIKNIRDMVQSRLTPAIVGHAKLEVTLNDMDSVVPPGHQRSGDNGEANLVNTARLAPTQSFVEGFPCSDTLSRIPFVRKCFGYPSWCSGFKVQSGTSSFHNFQLSYVPFHCISFLLYCIHSACVYALGARQWNSCENIEVLGESACYQATQQIDSRAGQIEPEGVELMEVVSQ